MTLDAVGRIKLLPALPFLWSPALLGLEVDERLFIVLLVGLAGILLVKLLILLVEERPPLWLFFNG